mgnify:FL=1
MKKFLLSLAAVVLAGASALAADYTITMKDVAPTDVSSFTAQGFAFTTAKNKGITAPAYNAAGDLRLYAKCSMTITAPAGVNITAINYTISKKGLNRQSNFTPSVGEVTEAAGSCSWAGSANTITFTVGDKATFGTDGADKAGQFCFNALTITTDKVVVGKDPAGLKFAESAITAKLGEAVPANTLSRQTDAAPVFSSSDVNVATVNAATGVVTLVAAGTTTITAETEATDDFEAGKASYTLTVVDPATAGNTIYEHSCQTEDCNFTFEAGEFNPWSIDATYGLKASAFKNGAANASDAYAVSPVLDLTGRVAPAEIAFEQAVNMFKLNNVMIDVADVVKYVEISVREEGTTAWTKLADISVPEKFAWTYYGQTIDLSAYVGKKIQIGFRYTSTAEIAGTWEIKNVKVTATKEGGKLDANLKFAEDAIKANLGEAAPANPLTMSTNAAVTYTSSDTNVATVDANTGAVTVKAVGTTTITANAAENDKYYAGTASYTLTVVDASNVVYESTCQAEDCGFTFEVVSDFKPWSIDATYGLKASAFKDGAANGSDAYAVSPVLDLTGRKAPAEIAFEQAVNMFKLNNVMIDVADVVKYVEISVREEGTTAWTKLADISVPEKFAWTYYGQTIDLSAYVGKKIQIGFHYTSTAEIAGTWEIKNVKVTADKAGVNDIIADDDNAPVVYYNLQGVRVENPANGLYIRVQGKKATKVLVR